MARKFPLLRRGTSNRPGFRYTFTYGDNGHGRDRFLANSPVTDQPMRNAVLTRYWIVVMLVAAFAGCAKLNLGGNGDGPLPPPSASPSSSPSTPPTPTICGTPSANANLVVVAMGNDVGPTSAPKYGTINGYAVVESGSFSGRAMLINQWLNQGIVSAITSKNVCHSRFRAPQRHRQRQR
jgi:hypothetical protein